MHHLSRLQQHAYAGLLIVFVLSTRLRSETVRFGLADVGMSYSAALFADDPLIEHEVTHARIVVELEVKNGDAANFVADLALPIFPWPGNTNALVLRGEELGWTGHGRFRHEEETDRFNGMLVAARFGAATYGEGFAGELVNGFVELDVPSYLRGDFDRNLVLDVGDIHQLAEQIREHQFSRYFDLNSDRSIDEEDLRIWVEELRNTYFGDANLDGEFNSSDLVQVFRSAEYEDTIPLNSTWETGDWNADGEFDSGDLVAAFQAAGYERGPRQTLAVPEPVGATGVFFAFVVAQMMSRRNSIRI